MSALIPFAYLNVIFAGGSWATCPTTRPSLVPQALADPAFWMRRGAWTLSPTFLTFSAVRVAPLRLLPARVLGAVLN
ncbi:MAG: hypothetical protein AAF317_04635 [Pseudomonadota bacterium]